MIVCALGRVKNMELYKRIKDSRIKIGMTQDELAKKMGYKSRSTIAKIESGENDILQSQIVKFAEALNTTPAYLMGWEDNKKPATSRAVKIPVLGRVVAGVPLEAVTDIIDYEEITPELASTGDFFALQIKGDSMMPRICEGDVVIVRKQPTVDSGSLAIVLINGEEATIKQVIVRSDGIMLQAYNPAVYPTHFYTCADIKKLPITILGKVVELRGKFL